jgi:hypothetical protein
VVIDLGMALRGVVLAFLFGFLTGAEDYLGFKERNAYWLEPAYGGLLFFFCAWWVARAARGREILHGTLIAVAVLLIAMAAGARLEEWQTFLVTVGVALGASWLGGWVAAQQAAPGSPPDMAHGSRQ